MGKFVIRTLPTGVKFDLKAANGEVIATSELYDALPGCISGVESLRKNAPTAHLEDQTAPGGTVPNPKFQLYRDKRGNYRFRLRARNGKIIAVSQPYATHAACLGGVESVRENAPSEEIEQQ